MSITNESAGPGQRNLFGAMPFGNAIGGGFVLEHGPSEADLTMHPTGATVN